MSIKRQFLVTLLALVPGALRAQGLAAQQGTGVALAAPIPLASYAQGQAMMAQAAQKAALLDINFTFINKTYENDQYAKEPITGKKIRTACVRFKASSGFRFRMDVPTYSLTTQGLTIEQNIAALAADGLAAKFQLGPCQDIGFGVGLRLKDVKVVYKVRPMLTFDQNNRCSLGWSRDTDDLKISIGDMNVLGVQNDIEKLAKDAVREAVNLSLDDFFGAVMRNELLKITVASCGQGRAGRP
jgi:hypothetical protein